MLAERSLPSPALALNFDGILAANFGLIDQRLRMNRVDENGMGRLSRPLARFYKIVRNIQILQNDSKHGSLCGSCVCHPNSLEINGIYEDNNGQWNNIDQEQ